MKKTLAVLSLFLALACALPAFGQTTLISRTTLSAAVTSTSQTTVSVASATGITAGNTMLFINGEAMSVNAVNGTTISVTRGEPTSRTLTHASGTTVWYGPYSYFQFSTPVGYPAGSCSRTGAILPFIDVNNNVFSDCLGGQWVRGVSTGLPSGVTLAPDPGAVLYTGINTNGTTLAATTQYCTEIDLPYNRTLTGLGFLLGTTGATDKHIAILYDASGNLLVNSATAGTTAGTASTYERIPFTATYVAIGPARYFGCLQTNGTTATVRMLITSVQDYTLTKGITGVTFGTVPATITVPTTFTTAVGPYMEMY